MKNPLVQKTLKQLFTSKIPIIWSYSLSASCNLSFRIRNQSVQSFDTNLSKKSTRKKVTSNFDLNMISITDHDQPAFLPKFKTPQLPENLNKQPSPICSPSFMANSNFPIKSQKETNRLPKVFKGDFSKSTLWF